MLASVQELAKIVGPSLRRLGVPQKRELGALLEKEAASSGNEASPTALLLLNMLQEGC